MLYPQEKIKRQFNRSAPSYDQWALVQKKMAQRLVRRLPGHPGMRLLDVGCGTGLLTRLLLTRFPDAEIWAVDMAEQMVEEAVRRLHPKPDNVRFWVADAETADWTAFPPFDFIVSNAVFQWFRQPEETVRKLKTALKPDGRLLAFTFGPDTFRELRSVFETAEQDLGLPRFSHTLPLRGSEQWAAIFRSAGFARVEASRWTMRAVYDNCLSLLRSVKGTGASYSEGVGLVSRTKQLMSEAMKRYDGQFRMDEGGVYATYEIIEIIGEG